MNRKAIILVVISLITIQIAAVYNGVALDPRWGDEFTNTQLCPTNANVGGAVSVEDGNGGIIVAWRDMTVEDLYIQKINSKGVPQWGPNGVLICTKISFPSDIISDGCGGAIVAWQGYVGSYCNVYIQHVNSTGGILWTTEGLPICTAGNNQQSPHLALDGAGGVYISWDDFRTIDGIYAQYVNSLGQIQWMTDGIPISIKSGDYWGNAIVSDGAGGAIIAWTYTNGSHPWRLYAQRLDYLGNFLWDANGTVISIYDSNYPKIISDDNGGAILTWWGGPGWWDIYAQKLNETGMPQWTSNGVPICVNSENQLHPSIASDCDGGAIITWTDMRSGTNYDIYAQYVNASGNVKWTSNGIPICVTADDQSYPDIIPNGRGDGGVFIAWTDHRSGTNDDVFIQQLAPDGVIQMPVNGLAVSLASGNQNNVKIISDGHDGAIVIWLDARGSNQNIYAHKIGTVIITEPTTVVDEGQLYSQLFESNDEDNVTSWNMISNATWLNFNPITHILSGTPSNFQIGKYWINISIRDGTYLLDWINYTLTVNNVNDPPQIITSDLTSASEDILYYRDYNASDIDLTMDTLTWDVNSTASFLNMDPLTGILQGTPDNGDVGSYPVNISVSDGQGGVDWQSFILSVSNVNDPPVITTTDVCFVYEYTYYSVDYEAIDIDPTGDTIHWNVNSNASWLSIGSNNGILNGTPINSDVGQYWVNVSCNDGHGGSDFTNYSLQVINVNDPPIIITNTIPNAIEDSSYSFSLDGVDIDPTNDSLRWFLNTSASWLSINSTSGELGGTPSNDDVGVKWVNISVADEHGGSNWRNFSLKIININDPPSISVNDVVNSTEDVYYSVIYHAIDIDPTYDVLTWSLKSNASWLSIVTASGLLRGTPENEDVGYCWVNVTVRDNWGGTDYSNFTLFVSNVNDPPIIITNDVTNSTQLNHYIVDYDASDIDPTADIFEWCLDTNATWLTINTETGLLQGVAEPGIFYVNVTVSDGNGGADYHNYTLTVSKLLDSDNDGSPDVIDTDDDGSPDVIDTDDDNDGFLDEWELFLGTDPLDQNSVPLDTDHDSIPDGDAANSQPWMDTDDDGDGIPDAQENAEQPNFIGQYWWVILILIVGVVTGLALILRRKPDSLRVPPEEPSPETPTPETDVCPKCGFDIEKGKPCPFCAGEKPPEPPKPQPQPETKPKLDRDEMLRRIEKAYKEGRMNEEQYWKNLEKFK